MIDHACLNAWFSQVDTEAIGVSGIVVNKLLQCAECLPSGYPEATLIQGPDPVVFYSVSVAHGQ